MTPTEAADTLFQRWIDQSGLPDTRIALPNVSFSPPTGLTWSRVSLIEQDEVQASMGDPGTRRFDHEGTLFVEAMAPKDGGSAAGLALATLARTVFGAQTITVAAGTIHTFSAVVRPRGIDEAGWDSYLVEVRFRYYETR